MPVILRAMIAPPRLWGPLLLAVALVAAGAPAEAAKRKKKVAKKPAVTPTHTPSATPTSTPIPFLRAAGACVRYEPGHHIVVAEVGESGRVYRIDKETLLSVKPRTGTRVRILFVETGDGPLAKRILSGPVPVAPLAIPTAAPSATPGGAVPR